MKGHATKQSPNLLSLPPHKANSQASPQKNVEQSSPRRSGTRDGHRNSSSGSQSRFLYKDHSLGNDGVNNECNTSGLNLSQHNSNAQQVPMPQPVVSFDITDHEIMKKQDYVVYHLCVHTKSIKWVVPLRYNNFKDLNDKLVKNHLYKDKVPPFPPKRFKRKSKEVIEERKKLLTQYLETLSTNINIFRDEMIIGFLKQDFHSLQIQNLAGMQEKFLNDLNDFSSMNPQTLKKSARSSFRLQTLKELQSLKGDMGKQNFKLHIQTRNRGLSQETDSLLEGAFSPLHRPTDQWRQRKFENLEEKLNVWLEEMQKNIDNQTQLILDFEDYYFGEKPIIPVDYLKRLFYGYLKNKGILDHLKECHGDRLANDRLSIKSKTLMTFLMKLMDNTKCHQIEDITQIWKAMKPDYIKECHFELMINDQQSIKEAALTLLKVYLDGKLFKVNDIIKDEKFAQKFYVWQTNKNRQQNSFTSNSSLSQASQAKKRNSFACSDKPHFGACNHLNTSRCSMNPRDLESPTLQKSASSQNFNEQGQISTSSRKNKMGPSRRTAIQVPFRTSLMNDDEIIKLGKEQAEEDQFANLDQYSSSGSSSDSDYLFNKKTQLEAKKRKRISVQVNVPREIVKVNYKDNTPDILKTSAQNQQQFEDEQQINEFKIEIDEKPGQVEAIQQSDNHQFDLSQEIQDLIKHYNRRFNLIYHTPQIEDLDAQKVLGQVNQYIFDQNKHNTGYKVKLTNLRRLVEGMRPTMKHAIQSKQLAPAILGFFNDLNCEIVKVIDENNRLIRYSFKRKMSQDFDQFMKNTHAPQLKNQRRYSNLQEEEDHLMLVSYQVAGLNKDRASITLFEFDEEKSRIDPSNFIIISQSISKVDSAKISFSSMNSQNTFDSKALSNQIGVNATTQQNTAVASDNASKDLPMPMMGHNFEMYRTLSAVTEDCDGEELGSISITANPMGVNPAARSSVKKSQQLKQQSLLLQTRFGKKVEEDAKEDDDDDEDEIIRKDNNNSSDHDEAQHDDSDQDKFLFESNFTDNKNGNASFHIEHLDDDQIEERELKIQSDLLQPGGHISAKASFSTSKSSNADFASQMQWVHQNDSRISQDHKFDEVLGSTHGDVSVIMRISDDHILLNKILSLFKGLANQINLSLHGLR